MKNDPKKFTAELLSMQEVYRLSVQLAEKISASSTAFDAVVGIARGGFPPARFLCDFLNIERLYSIQIKHYGSGAEQKEKAEILNENIGKITNKKILLADDVNDSGKSLQAASGLLQSASVLKTAVLHEKNTTEIKADFAGETIDEWKWLIYPWAITENVLEFLNKGNMLESNLQEARNFLYEKYELKIDIPTLKTILKFKSNYF
ncbi:MAG: phosphoribosyltransferase [Prolixibacteraceae bacterium]